MSLILLLEHINHQGIILVFELSSFLPLCSFNWVDDKTESSSVGLVEHILLCLIRICLLG
jgi:hypothetical protein